MVAGERSHEEVSVGLLSGGHRLLERDEGAPVDEGVSDGPEQRKVELPVQLPVGDVLHDRPVPVAPGEGLPHHVDGGCTGRLDLLAESSAQRPHGDVVHVLGCVDPDGIHVEVADQSEGVVD